MAKHMLNFPPRIRISVPAVVLFVVAAHLVRATLEMWLRNSGSDPGVAKDLSYLSVPPVLLLLTSPYLRDCRNHLLALLRPAVTSRFVLVSICVGVAMRVAYWAAITALAALGVIHDDPPSAFNGPMFELLRPAPCLVVLSFLVMAILIPATEEVINRGLILYALLKHGGIPAVVLSAAIFAAMHNPQTYIMSFLGGVVLGVQVLKFRTLWAPFLTHATFNTIVIIEQKFLYFIWNPVFPDFRLALFGLVATTIAIAFIFAVLLAPGRDAAGTVEQSRTAHWD